MMTYGALLVASLVLLAHAHARRGAPFKFAPNAYTWALATVFLAVALTCAYW